jgi:hypothetical protein
MARDEDLWTHALRASIDAVVLQFEAQVRAHGALSAQREESLRRDLAAQDLAVAALRTELGARDASLRALDEALQREAAECARLRDALARAEAAAAASARSAEAARADLDAKSVSLDALRAQFAAESAFAQGALLAPASVLLDAVSVALGAAVDATPATYAALKSRRPEAVLAAAMRERGRTVARAALTEPDSRALAAMAAAAGAELVVAEHGARYTASSMEKVGTRAEPAEEDNVLECAMPGLRMGGAQGLAVQPRVIVGTA